VQLFQRVTRRQSDDSTNATIERPSDDNRPDFDDLDDQDEQDDQDGNASGFDTTFEELGIAADLVAVLERNGVTTPFPIQALTIPDALQGRDVSGKARTGSGKTLAFGLPLIEHTRTARRRRPHSLVLVPTRELANQVAEALTPLAAKRGLWLCSIYGGASMIRQIKALNQGVDIVIATPGRLNDLLERGEMSVADVEFVVVDEADQMSDLGFLPQVRRILDQVEGHPQTLLFSATLDGAVGDLVRGYQKDPVQHEVPSDEEDISQLTQRFVGVSNMDRVEVTTAICAHQQRTLVFVATTRGADALVERLDGAGLKADTIHGRLTQAKRERALAAFAKGRTNVLVATNVAARGIHVDDVDVVIHFDPPEDAKVYLHRSGRTARAGASGLVVTLVQPEHAQAISRLQREIGNEQAIEMMRPEDERLKNLAAWEPEISKAPQASGRYSMMPTRRGAPPRGQQRNSGRGGGSAGYGGSPRGAVRGAAQPQGFAPRGRSASSGNNRSFGSSRRGR
jgi:superfamily II DNA/RNA helicase